jgi:hypothetical protein
MAPVFPVFLENLHVVKLDLNLLYVGHEVDGVKRMTGKSTSKQPETVDLVPRVLSAGPKELCGLNTHGGRHLHKSEERWNVAELENT